MLFRSEVTPGGGVHYLVDSRERIGVLGTRLVEVREVDAESSPAVVLGHHDGVGDPVGVYDFADDSFFQQLFHLAEPPKKKQLFSQERAVMKKLSLNANGTGANLTIGAGLPPK